MATPTGIEQADRELVFIVPADIANGTVSTSRIAVDHSRGSFTTNITIKYIPAGSEALPDGPMSAVSSDDGQRILRFSEQWLFIAVLSSVLERHGFPEDVFESQLSKDEYLMEAKSSYNKWQAGFSPRERRLSLVEIAEEDERSIINYQFDNGTFRTFEEPSDNDRRRLLSVFSDIGSEYQLSQKCYQNSLNAYLSLGRPDDIEYVEGIFYSKFGVPALSHHAWLEVRGYPLELTYGWHQPFGAEGVYYGQKVSENTITESAERAEQNDGRYRTPLSVPEDIRSELKESDLQKSVKEFADRHH